MVPLSPSDKDLIETIRKRLSLTSDAKFIPNAIIDDRYPKHVDLIITDEERRYIFQFSRTITRNTIASLNLERTLMLLRHIDTAGFLFGIVGRKATREAKELGKILDISVITVPFDIPLNLPPDEETRAVKLTSPKSWKIIAELIKRRESSIRQLALNTGVSYGWAHATVKSLASKGIVNDTGGYVSITDTEKLLNGIAWERPFERLFMGSFFIKGGSSFEIAREIFRSSSTNGIKMAFTSFTAGSLYTNYSVRHDAVYLYLQREDAGKFTDNVATNERSGVIIHMYRPDRNIWNDTRMMQGISVVSPAQTLLDLAGLGYSGRDLTLKMVENFAAL
jgi:hypothetical protein